MEKEVVVMPGMWPQTLMVPPATWEGIYDLLDERGFRKVANRLELIGVYISPEEAKTATFVEEGSLGAGIYEYRSSDSAPPQRLRAYPIGSGYYAYEYMP
jgi:hypothetical protein